MDSNTLPRLEGWLALQRDDYTVAAQEYADAADRVPTDHTAWNGLGSALYFQGQFSRSLSAHLESLRLKDENLRALIGASLSYCGMKDYSQAIQMSLKAIEQFPEFVDPCLCLAYIHRCRKDYRSAVQVLQRAVELEPENGNAYYELGVVCAHQGEFSRAHEYYLKALSLSPNRAPTFIAIGSLCLRQKNHLAAREAFVECLRTRPNLPIAQIGLAVAEVRLRHFHSAVLLLQGVIKANPTLVQPRQILFRLYLRLLRWREAWVVLRQMIQEQVHTKE